MTGPSLLMNSVLSAPVLQLPVQNWRLTGVEVSQSQLEQRAASHALLVPIFLRRPPEK